MHNIPLVHIEDVRTFVAVVEAGSVSGAARTLHLTQPAVSRRIQRLEQAVGGSLIDRRRRPFGLTEMGRAAFQRCRHVLTATDELRSLAHGGELPWRELTIGVAHALTELAVTTPIEHLRRRVPSAVVRLHTGWSHDLLTRVKNGALDAAVILLFEREGVPTGVTADRIARERLVVIAGRQTSLHVRRAADLDGADWVLNPDGCAARAELRRTLAKANVGLRVGVETYDYELQIRLAAAGRGLGLVPRRVLSRSRTRAKVRTLDIPDLRFPMNIWMATGAVPSSLESPLHVFRTTLARTLKDDTPSLHG